MLFQPSIFDLAENRCGSMVSLGTIRLLLTNNRQTIFIIKKILMKKRMKDKRTETDQEYQQ